ncbi:RHS repeat-associated core domain-containing protein [Pontiella sulfatireligans]|uniref:RHS repeat-associated core domain-containing protein n=1 Tax=Pontiella sulfatireligans TaxID=2750658 RepID=UPI0014447C56|nr:RHS repeat-associated core domain-containing protein [Pontiella sulfatireligans]
MKTISPQLANGSYAETETGYDANGNVEWVKDASGNISMSIYDYRTRDYAYDRVGNRTNVVESADVHATVSCSCDALNRIGTIVEGTNTTTYGYDLNSKPVYREYPTGVEEVRSFDPMGRLLTMTTTNMNVADNGWFSMAYEYDLVGSALKMAQTSANLLGTQDAVTTWEYDDRCRLTAETVALDSDPASTRTEYTWDNADNRRSMTKYVGGSLASTTTYTNNALNQLTGYVAEAPGLATTNVVFAYDANGSRTNKSVSIAGGSPASSACTYDEDNRLVAAALNGSATTHTFAYDYRSRRYYRSTPTTSHMFCVFDGGLSIQEHETASSDLTLNPLTLNTVQTEFVRGEGMGGGVGGMVYSIKRSEDPQLPTPNNKLQTPLFSHANHRGDVIARSNASGSLTSFALYEAYGTRPYEWGDDPDRQKANTKEEESDLQLLNEGMRYRDLETGTFLTRDPIGYADGPNVYCYVHCNPITHFDALGLEEEAVSDDNSLTAAATQDGTLSAVDALTEETAPSFVPEPQTPQYGPTIAAAEAQSSSQQADGSVSGTASDTPRENEKLLNEAGVGTQNQQREQQIDPDVYLNPRVYPPPPEGSPAARGQKQFDEDQLAQWWVENRIVDAATGVTYPPPTPTETFTTIVSAGGDVMTALGGVNPVNVGNAVGDTITGNPPGSGIIGVARGAQEFKQNAETQQRVGSGSR